MSDEQQSAKAVHAYVSQMRQELTEMVKNAIDESAERMAPREPTCSETLGQLFAARAKAQAEIEAALKKSKNPHYQSSYADLASVMQACLPALGKHGISVVQVPVQDENGYGIKTILGHSSGEFIASTMMFTFGSMSGGAVIHKIGSALTYARRYSLAAMCGVASDDDDGNAAAGMQSAPPQAASRGPNKGKPPGRPKKASPKKAPPPIDEAPPPSDDDAPSDWKHAPQESAEPKPETHESSDRPVPKAASDVIATAGPHKGVALPEWPTQYAHKVQRQITKKAEKLAEQDQDLPEHMAASLSLIREELVRRLAEEREGGEENANDQMEMGVV